MGVLLRLHNFALLFHRSRLARKRRFLRFEPESRA